MPLRILEKIIVDFLMFLFCFRLKPSYSQDNLMKPESLIFESRFECGNLRKAIQVLHDFLKIMSIRALMERFDSKRS